MEQSAVSHQLRLLRMVELSVRPSDDAAWDDLFEYAKHAPSQPYEMVELYEARARAVASPTRRMPRA